MSNSTNIDKLIERFLVSAYEVKKTYYCHDAIYIKGTNNKIEGYDLMNQLVTIFDCNSLKLFYLFNRWCLRYYPDAILFDYWNKKIDKMNVLPEYMKKGMDFDYSEVYQEFYLDAIDY